MSRVTPEESRSIAVVGAGVGGLTVAARLAHAGHRVTVFEKNTTPGGRCGVVQDGGFSWDLGPTILLMRDVIEGVFSDCGRNPADYLELMRCDPNYRIHFADGTSVLFGPNLAEMRDELERVEPGAFEAYLSFLQKSRHHFDASVDKLVTVPLDGPTAYLNPSLLKTVLSVRALRKLHPWLGGFFKDERLRRALGFQTMYLGLSPYDAPATFSLLPYTELAMGIWYPKGGLYRVPLALERLARECGAEIRYDAPVEKILCGRERAEGVRVRGVDEKFDVVVCNADLPYAYERLAPQLKKPFRKPKYTSSAFMLYLGVDRKYEQLEHHNVVFGGNYRETFEEIFKRGTIPDDPSFYVNRPSQNDPSVAPPGHDALYVLVPVPHQNETIDWKVAGPKLREKTLDLMESRLGLTDLRKHIVVEHQLTPDGWADRFNLAKGSAFGLSHVFTQVGALRPSTRDRTLNNLYFVGASTQPGTGVPLVMLSARIVTERLSRELAELPKGTRAATPPGEQEAA
jgi:phytoene desaturase